MAGADLAGGWILHVKAPTLLIVGGNDWDVRKLNAEARERLKSLKEVEKRLVIVPGATHLFEEPGRPRRGNSVSTGLVYNISQPRKGQRGAKIPRQDNKRRHDDT